MTRHDRTQKHTTDIIKMSSGNSIANCNVSCTIT